MALPPRKIKRITRNFTRAELEQLGLPYEGYDCKILANEMYDKSRWAIEYELVFRLPEQPEDEAWRVYYWKGATEYQEQDVWNDASTVTATLVRATPVTRIEYRSVEAPPEVVSGEVSMEAWYAEHSRPKIEIGEAPSE